MPKLIITDQMINDIKETGMTVTDAIAHVYASDIAEMIDKQPSLNVMDAFQLAFMDAGFNKSTLVGEIIQTSGNEWLFPAFIDRRLRESVSSVNILQYIIGGTQFVGSNSVRSSKLVFDDKNKDGIEMKRVAEGTDIPLATLSLADNAVSLYKRGRAVETTYEAYRNMSVDMFGKMLDLIANDAAKQQVRDAIITLLDGDGNKNKAQSITITGANGLTAEELIIFAIEFFKRSGLPLTTIITGDGDFYKQLMMTTFNVKEVNGLMAGARFNFPQAQMKELTVLYDPSVPKASTSKEQLIGLNKEFSLTKYIESGSQIREHATVIRNQTKLGTITETAGFSKIIDNAVLALVAK